MTDVALSIEVLVPAAKYGGVLTGNNQAEYDTLRWNDARPKPNWAAVQAVVVPKTRLDQLKSKPVLTVPEITELLKIHGLA